MMNMNTRNILWWEGPSLKDIIPKPWRRDARFPETDGTGCLEPEHAMSCHKCNVMDLSLPLRSCASACSYGAQIASIVVHWWPMQNAKLCKIIELHSLYLLVKTCKPQRESQCDDQRFQSKVIWRFRRLPESARVCCRISRSYRLNETAAQQSPCKYTRIRILMCPHCLMTQHPGHICWNDTASLYRWFKSLASFLVRFPNSDQQHN
jgi:hypothetical protein